MNPVYGRTIPWVIAAIIASWAFVLIVLPQFAIIATAFEAPKRQLPSAIAQTLNNDAGTCISILKRMAADTEAPEPASSGLAIPSMSSPSLSLAIPSMGSATKNPSKRQYILQCERTTTKISLNSDPDAEPRTLASEYDLPELSVIDTEPLNIQIEQAETIQGLAVTLASTLIEAESQQSSFSWVNFEQLIEARLIPMTSAQKLEERGRLDSKLWTALGLRFEKDGEVYKRISLITLARTLVFAMITTALAFIACYPVAYAIALASGPTQALWLVVALIVPYSIAELMRIYAWTSVIANNGLLNTVFDFLGFLSIEAGEAVEFKRSPMTVFVVILYTYILFMMFPMINVLSTLDKHQILAAKDLGAPMWRVHWRIVLPHAKPGIAVGAIATFMLASGAFSVPRIISRGLQGEWFAQTIYNKFFESQNGNVGAAFSVSYVLVCFVIVAIFMYLMRSRIQDFAKVR